jgi:hypothetical protein
MFVLILIFILCLCFIFSKSKEQFNIKHTRITRPTRNMSYDLRGEAYYPPLLNIPFNKSSIAPFPNPELIDKNGICV